MNILLFILATVYGLSLTALIILFFIGAFIRFDVEKHITRLMITNVMSGVMAVMIHIHMYGYTPTSTEPNNGAMTGAILTISAMTE